MPGPSSTNGIVPRYERHIYESVLEQNVGIDEARDTCANDAYRVVKHTWRGHEGYIVHRRVMTRF